MEVLFERVNDTEELRWMERDTSEFRGRDIGEILKNKSECWIVVLPHHWVEVFIYIYDS